MKQTTTHPIVAQPTLRADLGHALRYMEHHGIAGLFCLGLAALAWTPLFFLLRLLKAVVECVSCGAITVTRVNRLG